MQSFYITVSSNKTKFESSLPQQFELSDTWVAGLSEIYIKSSNNIKNDIERVEVHSDIIRFHFFNEKLSDIIRFIDIPSTDKIQYKEIFKKIMYFPLSKYEFDNIKFNLSTDGKEIVLDNFEIFITLHFKDCGRIPYHTLEPYPEGYSSDFSDTDVDDLFEYYDIDKN